MYISYYFLMVIIFLFSFGWIQECILIWGLLIFSRPKNQEIFSGSIRSARSPSDSPQHFFNLQLILTASPGPPRPFCKVRLSHESLELKSFLHVLFLIFDDSFFCISVHHQQNTLTRNGILYSKILI
jgi:hypothetical protein